MATVERLLQVYERENSRKHERGVDIRVTYFHGLSRGAVGPYLRQRLADVNGNMTPWNFRSATSNNLRFESFCSGLKMNRYTLMVSRADSAINFEPDELS